MRTYPVPFNEDARVRAVSAVPGLTEENEPLFDAICDAAKRLLDCPIAHISVVEQDTQWYKAVVGINLERMHKDNSFCTHTIMSNAPLVVPDLSKDPRFSRHPMVVAGGPQARYYAGVPLVLSSGYRFGSLCALDFVAHEPPSEHQMAVLADLGRAVVAALERAQPQQTSMTEDEMAKQTFLTLIGHELRTPLTILFGSLKLLELRAGGEASQSLTRAARKSVEHLLNLVETIITFSDAMTGELRLDEVLCDITDVLEIVSDLSLPGADGKLKEIKIQQKMSANQVFVDPSQLKLALTALVLNAINHGGDEVTVTTGLDADGNIEISVVDNGNLDENVDLAELYRPFIVGGDIDQRHSRGGLGLGLPLTRKLIELHGGNFEVRAEHDRTSAIIRLPAWRSEVTPDILKLRKRPIQGS